MQGCLQTAVSLLTLAFVLAADGLVALGQQSNQDPAPPPAAAPTQPAPVPPADPTGPTPPPPRTTAPQPANPPVSDLLASAAGAAIPGQDFAPFMIGDAFGGGLQTLTFLPENAAGKVPAHSFSIPNPSGGVVGNTSLAENFSPMPRDRVFLNYSYFDQVPLTPGGVGVNRYTPGFEKTFFDGQTSIEFRTPFAGTLDNTINDPTVAPTATGVAQFGNVFTAFKALLLSTDRYAISGGMALTLPTASDVTIAGVGSGPTQIRFHNQAVHLTPFLAFLLTPNDRFFCQGLLQVDVAANPNPVTTQVAGLAPQDVGSFRDQTVLTPSLAAGYWLYRRNGPGYVTGISPIVEAHYSRSLNRASVVQIPNPTMGNIVLGDPNYQFQLLNMTSGANIQFGPMSSLLLAYTTPVGSGSDKQFHGEFRAVFNRRFGPQNRLTRVQF